MTNDIRVIGIAKSGTNATEKACRLIGLNPTHHQHTANYHIAETEKVAYVYRHPRNVLISAVRYWNAQVRGSTQDITEEKLIDKVFDMGNASIYAIYYSHLEWLDSKACVFRFEDLIASKDVMDKIADYMNVERPSLGKFLALQGDTPTWTGRLSNWEEHWTDKLNKIWKAEGMLEIERLYGYS